VPTEVELERMVVRILVVAMLGKIAEKPVLTAQAAGLI
jgi:hypothetical protein